MALTPFTALFHRLFPIFTLAFFLLSSLFLSFSHGLPVRADYGCGEYGSNYNGYGGECAVPLDETNIAQAINSLTCNPGDGGNGVALITKPTTCSGVLKEGYLPPQRPLNFKVEATPDGEGGVCNFANRDFDCLNIGVGTIPGGRRIQYRFGNTDPFQDLTVNGNPKVIQVQPAITFYTDSGQVGPYTSAPGVIDVGEGGAFEPVYYKLNKAPQAGQPVSFTVQTDDQTEVGAGNTVTKTISNGNWNSTNVNFGVRGVDDTVAEASPHVGIVSFTALSSNDPFFDGIPIQVYPGGVPSDFALEARITDNDSAGLSTDVPGNTLTLAENNVTEEFELVLNSSPAPGTVVKVNISHAGSSGTIDANTSTYTFSPSNWNTPRPVRLTSVDDDFDRDDTGTVNIVVDDAATTDDNYDGLSQAVSVNYLDDDTAGFEFDFDETTQSQDVSEGQTTQYKVRLTSRPTNSQTIRVSALASDPEPGDEDFLHINAQPTQNGVAGTNFTDSDWDTFKNVTLRGVEDSDGISETATVTSGIENQPGIASEYAALAGNYTKAFPVNVFDNDVAGFTIALPADGEINLDEGDLSVVDSYTLRLNTAPTGDVVVLVDPDSHQVIKLPEDADFRSPNQNGTLTFNSGNWDTPQTVEVRARDDDTVEGPHQSQIVHSIQSTADPDYNGLPSQNVTTNILDNDDPGLVITPVAGTSVAENGGTLQYEVRLANQPKTDVYVDTSDQNPARAVVTSPAQQTDANGDTYRFVFKKEGTDPQAWNKPQLLTLEAIDNNYDRDTTAGTEYSVVDSLSDPLFAVVPNEVVTTTIINDDTAGVELQDLAGNPLTTLDVAEGGPARTFRARLTAQPFKTKVDVTLSAPQVSINNLGVGNDASLTFVESNWNDFQDVTIEADNDAVDEADPHTTGLQFTTSSTDEAYQPANLTIPPLPISIADNDTAGLEFSAVGSGSVTPLVVSEGQSQDFLFRLQSRPTSPVVVNFASSNTAEASLSSADFSNGNKLTFTPSNWYIKQTVTVTNTEDNRDVENETAVITASVVDSDSAAEYRPVANQTMDVQVTDNDTAAISVISSGGSNVAREDGTGGDSYRLRLETDTAEEVVVDLGLPASPRFKLQENGTDTTQVRFGAGSVAGTEIVLGIVALDDNVDNPQNSMNYNVTHTVTVPANTASPYHNLAVDPAVITVVDNDAAGVTVRRKAGSPANTDEANLDQEVVFELFLNTEPTAPVTIDEIRIDPSDIDDATFDSAHGPQVSAGANIPLTTTPTEITLYGRDDSVDDGDEGVRFITSALTSADTKYNGLNPLNLDSINLDNDTAQILISPVGGGSLSPLVIAEGQTRDIDVTLATEPTSNVIVNFSSSNTDELIYSSPNFASGNRLTFTPANWNQAQSVTLVNPEDNRIAANESATATAGVIDAESAQEYRPIDPATFPVQITDNDTAGVTIQGSNFQTTEAGGTTDIRFVLDSQPTDSVTIPLSISDPSEGSIEVTEVVILPENWDQGNQNLVIVTGLDDTLQDGNITYQLVTGDPTSNDTDYEGLSAGDVANASIVNLDNDVAGITVTKRGGAGNTSEDGSQTVTFDFSLNTDPNGETVEIPLSFSVPGEASFASGSSVATTTASLTFGTTTSVTVYGLDDEVADGDVTLELVTGDPTSNDAVYDDFESADVADISFINFDDDTAGILHANGPSFTASENGGSATVKFRLDSQPTAPVSFEITNSDPDFMTVDKTSLTIEPANWNNPDANIYTITSVDNEYVAFNGTAVAYHGNTTSADANYNGLSVAQTNYTMTDDETASISVVARDNRTTTSEDGTQTITYDVIVDTDDGPFSQDVEVPFTLSDSSEASFSSGSSVDSIVVTTNHDAPGSFTVYGVDDFVDDGDINYDLVSGDPRNDSGNAYDALGPDDVADFTLTNIDDDTAGVQVLGAPYNVSENGTTATARFRLDSRPTASVTIPLSVSDATEASLSATQITITPENWNQPANNTVTITGLDDNEQDGTASLDLVTGRPTSSDSVYAALTAADTPNVEINNADNDTASILVTPRPDSRNTSEDGEQLLLVDISLATDPGTTVELPLTINDGSEASFASNSSVTTRTETLIFGTTTTVTVYGVDDDVADGDKNVTLVTGDPSSANPDYDNLEGTDVNNVQFQNFDDDTASFAFPSQDPNNPNDGTIGGDAVSVPEGASETFPIQLGSEPDGTVVLAATTGGPLSISPASLTFDASNWNERQLLTFASEEDEVLGDLFAQVEITSGAGTTASEYQNVNETVDVTIVDNDAAGITVNALATETTEAGGAVTVEFTLDKDPDQTTASETNVQVPLTLLDATETSFDASSSVTTTDLSLTYGTTASVTVYGVDDAVADGDKQALLETGDPVSANASYDALNASDVADVILTNLDDDEASVVFPSQDPNDPNDGTVSGDAVTLDEGTSETFPFVLSSEPSGTVLVNVANGLEVETSPAQLTFDASNWNERQLITLTSLEDDTLEDDTDTMTLTVDGNSTASEYQGVNATVDLTINNNDAAQITLVQTDGANTSEDRTQTVAFTLDLTADPETTVEVPLTLSPAEEASFAESSAEFTRTVTLTYGAPATVTIYGQDDAVDDGDQTVTLATGDPTSSNADYNNLTAQDVPDAQFLNLDDDTATILSPQEDPNNPDDGTISGLEVTLAEGTSETYPLRLGSQPTAPVVLTVGGAVNLNLTPQEFTFTEANWNETQLVTVESLENNNLGDQTDIFEIAVDADRSPGSGYENAATYLVSATILDNDTAGYILVESGESTEVGEGGASDTYELSLTAIPNETVTIDLSASEDIAVNPAQIVFTANAGSNWNQPQTVTVSAVDDDLIEETENTTITHAVTTNDTDYQNAPVPDVPVVVNDNEEVAVNLVPTGGVEGGDLGILEGEAETFAIALSGEPTAPVTFDIASTSLEEAAPTPERLTIAPADWDQPRIITVQNTEDDVIADDTATLTVTVDDAQSASEYAGVSDTLSVVIVDNDTANVVATPVRSVTSEDQTEIAEIRFALTSRPSQPVTLALASSDETEGRAASAELVIEPEDWNLPENNVVLVGGVDDNEVDDDITYALQVTEITSEDSDYDALDDATVPELTLENLDDDTAKPTLVVTYLGNAQGNTVGTTSELGTKAVAQFELEKQPIDDESVTILFESTDLTEGTTSLEELVITSENWNQSTANQVEITGVDDFLADGDIAYALDLLDITSGDAGYDVIEDEDLTDPDLENLDNDTLGVAVDPTELTLEEGQTGQFSVRLFSEPTEDVELKFTYDEARVKLVSVPAPSNAVTQALFDLTPVRLQESTDSFFFTSENWQTTKFFEVTAVENGDYLGNDLTEEVEIELITSGDYAEEEPSDVTVTIRDNDPKPTATPRTGGVDNRVWFTLLTVLLAVAIASYIYRHTGPSE